MQFSNSATAASADIDNGGIMYFTNGATAGSANVLNYSHSSMQFFDSSSAGDGTTHCYDTSFIRFFDSSTAGNATIFCVGQIEFKVRISRTDEELMIARSVCRIAGLSVRG